MTTKKSFNGVFWHSLNNNNGLESDAFSVAQTNNISISLAKLLINRNVKKIPNFLNSKLKENISITEIMKLHNIERSINFFEKVKLEKKIAIFSDYDVDGATSTQIRVTAIPTSTDVVPVRNQILEIDLVNSTVTGQVDNTTTTGVGYTTTTSGTASTTSVNTTTSYPTSSGY